MPHLEDIGTLHAPADRLRAAAEPDCTDQTPRATKRKRIAAKDLKFVTVMPLYFVLACLVPSGAWGTVTHGLGAISRSFNRRNALRGKIASLLTSTNLGSAAEDVFAELEAGRIEAYFEVFRSYAPWGWTPKVRLAGAAHLEAALAARCGAILWVDHFVFNGLFPKRVLAEAGHSVAHLSRPEHGFSKTDFGINWLNPIRVRIEDRYLADRILIERGAETKAVRAAMKG